MISQIHINPPIATYLNQAKLHDLRPINYIFGVNGTGKTTISLQNTLRCILENYFTMWGGMGKDELCALFDGREKLICQSLFSWVNDGSHSIHDDLYINQGEQTNEAYLRVFRSVFDKVGQAGHYNMMTGSV